MSQVDIFTTWNIYSPSRLWAGFCQIFGLDYKESIHKIVIITWSKLTG